MVRFTAAHAAKLTGDAEAIHRNTDVRIAELQAQAQLPMPGRLLGRQVLRGKGVYVPTPGTCVAFVEHQGPGGGGGGAGGGAGVAAGGGGNSGWYLPYLVGTPGVPLKGGAYDAGVGVAGGAATPAAGATGGDATLTIAGVTRVAKGGTGGTAGTKSANGLTGPNTPAAGSSPTSGALYGEGGLGRWYNTGSAASGSGGTTPLGLGGFAVGGDTAGIAGTDGGGGSGASAAAGAQAGGPGGNGVFVIWDFA